MNLEIRYANEKDLIFIDHLQKLNEEELSFYPKVEFERDIQNQLSVLESAQKNNLTYEEELARINAEGDWMSTYYGTNLEAAEEISRQLRIRDSGGLIVIDFIDMIPPLARLARFELTASAFAGLHSIHLSYRRK